MKKFEKLNNKFREGLKDTINEIIRNEVIFLTKDDVQLGGNIDVEKIRNLASKIGFGETKNGRYLVEIKNKRNRLAHGEQTFHDIGKDFTYKGLDRRKQDVFEYLEDVIVKIEGFIATKKYKKSEL